MNLNPDLEIQLNQEIRKGRLANDVYTSYLSSFIKQQKDEVYLEFMSVDPTDTSTLMFLNLRFKAIQSLDDAVQRDIITGQMAQQQLEVL